MYTNIDHILGEALLERLRTPNPSIPSKANIMLICPPLITSIFLGSQQGSSLEVVSWFSRDDRAYVSTIT